MIGARNITAAFRRSLLVGRRTTSPMIQGQQMLPLVAHHGRSSMAARSFVSRTGTQWMPIKTIDVSLFRMFYHL